MAFKNTEKLMSDQKRLRAVHNRIAILKQQSRNDGVRLQEGDGIKETFETAKSVLKKVIFGINDYSKQSANTLRKYGGYKVKSISLGKYPIESQGGLEKILKAKNILTKGDWEKSGNQILQELGYDALYHVYSICELENGLPCIVEKQTQFTCVINYPGGPMNKSMIAKERGGELNEISFPTNQPDLTLAMLVEKTRKKMGDQLFFEYNSNKNNCQGFLNQMLLANNLMTPERKTFIFQNLKTLYENLPWFVKAISDVSTEFEARVIVPVQQGGRKKTIQNGGNLPENLFDYIAPLQKEMHRVLPPGKQLNDWDLDLKYFIQFRDEIADIDAVEAKIKQIMFAVKKQHEKQFNKRGMGHLKDGKKVMSGKSNPWVAHVKAYASKNNMKYGDAMKSAGCKSSYKKVQSGKGVLDELVKPVKFIDAFAKETFSYADKHNVNKRGKLPNLKEFGINLGQNTAQAPMAAVRAAEKAGLLSKQKGKGLAEDLLKVVPNAVQNQVKMYENDLSDRKKYVKKNKNVGDRVLFGLQQNASQPFRAGSQLAKDLSAPVLKNLLKGKGHTAVKKLYLPIV